MGEEPGPGEAEQRLFAQRIVVLGAQIDDALAESVTGQLRRLEADDPTADISLYLNSPGGSVAAGMTVLDTMQRIRVDVRTYGVGLVAGVASLLLAAGAPGKRFLLPAARVHLSEPTSTEPMNTGPTSTDTSTPDDRLRSTTVALYGRHTGRPTERIAADLAAQRWFDAQEATEYGFADAVVGGGPRA